MQNAKAPFKAQDARGNLSRQTLFAKQQYQIFSFVETRP
jgi:hypothetical protein